MAPHVAVKYRPEIDGLRAFAVVPVILFHAGFAPFRGGYVGVDVFFVISGYLITTIILDELKRGSFSIINFYERRARRILPALFVVVVACIPLAWMWMLPRELKDFGQSVAAVALFSSNVLFWWEAGYFEAAAELKPLLHTWSLAVEEQFYLGFPLLLLWLWRPDGRTTFLVIAALAVLSLAIAQWGMEAAPSATFFLLPARVWELGAGVLTAMTAPHWRRVEGWRAEVGSFVGLGLIVFAVLVLTEASWVPGISALAPVLGAVAVIMFARPSTMAGKLLAWRPVVGLGLISYSAYLWHQPIFAFARLRNYGSEISHIGYVGLIALALLLAYVTWKLVEQPARRRGSFDRKQVFGGSAAAGVALLGIGSAISLSNGAPYRIPPEVERYASWADVANPYRATCGALQGKEKIHSPTCRHGATDGDRVAVWGDSHAMEPAWQLAERLTPLGVGVRELTHHACMPIRDYYRRGETASCREFREEAFGDLSSNAALSAVVLLARWAVVLDPAPFNNGEGGQEPGSRNILTEEQKARRAAQLRSTVETLLQHGRNVVLVYPIPEVGWHVPNYLAGQAWFGDKRTGPLSTNRMAYEDRTRVVQQTLNSIQDHPNLVRIRPADLFCDTVLLHRCVAQIGDKPLYFDDNHLNSVGAGILADAIIAALTARRWLPLTAKARPLSNQ